MNILGRVTVLPHLPERISRLDVLARNLYWTWAPPARALFRHLDRELWERIGHNPVVLLRDISQDRLDEAAADEAYVARYDAVMAAFDAYLAREDTWFSRNIPDGEAQTYAYFCAEYGWHEAVALYSGGLGILAGDHTKAASDLGVPLVAVGLWYPEGYFHQLVAADGQQEAIYERRSPQELPVELARTPDGDEAKVSVTLQGREVYLRAWRANAGCVPIYLLDSDLPENDPADRILLQRLYGGDQRTRISQEIILGIGGVRMLRALGVSPTAWHMNEGHSAFMALERCRELVEAGLPFDQAREVITAGTNFTVHTPVAAGNDAFPFDLVSQFFGGYWGSLGLNQSQFFDLGRFDHGWGQAFSMPALALRFSSGRNGVAALHGETSRRLWNDLWPEVPTDEVPIGHITNGVHMPSWVAPEIRDLVATVMPEDWEERFDDAAMWENVREIDDAALWAVRSNLKEKSIAFLRRRVLHQLVRQGALPTVMQGAGGLLDPKALTIGFARRFATYKRATLIFQDLERLERLLNNPERPVQLIFSGKAHPADKPGQALIARIQTLSQTPEFAGKILFVENYDISVGRALTRGVDVWLNNPRRPLEASGTSGQKAAMNGVLNLSILDGWWPEGYNGENGWAIGTGHTLADPESADAADADALYNLLEREVVPLYYNRDEQGVPDAWMDRAKEAVATITPLFNARRMVQDYVTAYYAPASQRTAEMTRGDYAPAKELAEWRGARGEHLAESLPVGPLAPKRDPPRGRAHRSRGGAAPPRALPHEDLRVELVYSREEDELRHDIRTVEMTCVETYGDGGSLYKVTFEPHISGRLAYGVRVYPVHEGLTSPFDVHAIRWA